MKESDEWDLWRRSSRLRIKLYAPIDSVSVKTASGRSGA